ncbi:MAG: restriction endonuclease [Thermodesulfobacteriota bacterium]
MILITFLTFLELSHAASGNHYYRWKDDKGVTHITDNPDDVPVKFRKEIIQYEKKDTSVKSKIADSYNKSLKIIQQYKFYIIGSILFILLLIIIKKIINKASLFISKNSQKRLERLVNKSGIAEMSEINFKNHVKELLIKSGYKLELIESPFDTASDFIALKNRKKYTVLISTNINDVSEITINYIESETEKYGCNGSIIISKSYFDEAAFKLAKKINCRLINRNEVAKAIVKKLKF